MDREAAAAGVVAAPPVVLAMVVHAPGPWFDDTLKSLVAQDYPNLNTYFAVTGSAADPDGVELEARIHERLPQAFVEHLGANPGFAAAANTVLDFVEGDNGFFCICHDDVALDADAIRLMVEELYRSNAGIVGPKLVSWDDANVLQNVGFDVDRFGQPASRVDPGEQDQEQHDAVTDVFAVPSSCLLVRADLFRSLGGFDTSMSFHGEDIDLCWRAHISSARVMVAPGARVRHREELESRRPDLGHEAARSRHRLRSTLTLTAGARLPIRLVELLVVTLLELAVGLFTGHVRQAWASLRALVGAVPRFPTLLARRGAIAKFRQISDAEVHGLQSRGSNRLRSFRRSRETQTVIGMANDPADGGVAVIRRWRERSLAPVITWTVVIVAVLAASRTLINRSVPTIGEFLPFPDSPRQLWSDFLSGWNPNGLGSTSPNPTGLAVLALGSVLWFFQMGAGLTVAIVGSILLGGLGVWRLADLFPSNRERIVALVTYVAMPLLPGVISTGRLSALIAFAALPWFVHLVRLAAGIGTADPGSVAADLPDGVLSIDARERVRRTAVAGLVAAVAVALAPPVLIVLAGVAAVLGVSSLLAGAGVRTSAWMTGTGLVACAMAWLLNVPASAAWSWNDLSAIPLAGANGRGLANVASMDIGDARLVALALAFYVPVITGLVLSRAWRLTWAARAGGLVIAFATLAVLQDRDELPVRLPDVGLLLVPVALGLAISAACAVASFVSDVAGGTFGWRQPLGVVSIAAVACGMFPALVTITNGSWFAPRTTMSTMLTPTIEADDFGDFRVLYLGDPRVMPVAPHDLGDGIAMAIASPGAPDIRGRWAPPDTPADDTLAAALREIADGVTQRGGRLLAPYGIRYIVVPRHDGAISTPDDPIEPPQGLSEALGAQLDLQLRVSPPDYDLYENASAIPIAASFDGDAAAASSAESVAELVAADLTGATALFGDITQRRSGFGEVAPGVVHLSVPFDDNWTLRVDGAEVAPRSGFSVLTAYDVDAPGQATLSYESPSSRRTALLGQAALWALVLIAASRMRVPRSLPRARPEVSEGVIDLDDDDVELPHDGVGVPLIPLEEAAAPRPLVAAGRTPDRREPALFRADDENARAAWVEEIFADVDDEEQSP